MLHANLLGSNVAHLQQLSMIDLSNHIDVVTQSDGFSKKSGALLQVHDV